MIDFQIEDIRFHERSVNLRLPFRFGVATLVACPQVHVLVRVKFSNGQTVEACSAEMMVPKWFDKNTALSNEENFEQLRFALKATRSAYTQDKNNQTAWQYFIRHYDDIVSVCASQGINSLAASYGPALIDRALIDAVCHFLGQSFYEVMKKNAVGIDLHQHPKLQDLSAFNLERFLAELKLSQKISARHTVGLIDPLLETDLTADSPSDGLPVCLKDIARHYGHTHYKLKLSGNTEFDVERLEKIASVIGQEAQAITLDGNEQYQSAEAFQQFFEKFKSLPKLQSIYQKTLFVEQPIHRDQTLGSDVSAIAQSIPLLVDESDNELDTFLSAAKLGYTGISSKSCKGVYKSIVNAARCRQMTESTGRKHFQSGEDLTMQAGVAVQQDLALVNLLGLTHVERNGHHYVNGMAALSHEEQQAFQKEFPSLYETSNDVVRLRIQHGQIDLSSLNCQGFATGRQRSPIEWDKMPTEKFSY